MNKEFYVIRDSREKNGWDFPPEEKKNGKFKCLGTKIQGLSEADYTIMLPSGEILNNEILIERKSGFQELFGNYIPSSNKERFENEMDRLKSIKNKYLIIETSLNLDSWAMSIPQFYKGPPCSKLFEWTMNLYEKYGILPIWAGNCGQQIARKIFEEFLRKNV